MTGPEHYAEAERLLQRSRDSITGDVWEHHGAALAAAQVHATLALVAAATETTHTQEDNNRPGSDAIGLAAVVQSTRRAMRRGH